MNTFVYVLFGSVLTFVLVALFMRPRWYRTGGYISDLNPYARHGGCPYRPGILY